MNLNFLTDNHSNPVNLFEFRIIKVKQITQTNITEISANSIETSEQEDNLNCSHSQDMHNAPAQDSKTCTDTKNLAIALTVKRSCQISQNKAEVVNNNSHMICGSSSDRQLRSSSQ